MASDCRIGFRLNLFNVLILKVLLLAQLSVLTVFPVAPRGVGSLPLYDLCDYVDNCTCSKLDSITTTIECPNDRLYESHPITAKVHVLNGTGALELICDYGKPGFNWRLVRGLDFKRNNQEYVITTLAISHCPIPPENDGLDKILSHLDIDAGDVTIYKYLSRRQLDTFPDYMLKPLVNITFLDLSQNNLTSIPNLAHFPNLRTLEFHSNQITSLVQGTFSNNGQLQRVALRGNSLETIQDGSLPDSLDMLDVINNRISSLSRNTFPNLHKVRRMYLSKNPLESLDEFTFSNLTKLGDLRLDWCQFRTFPSLDNLRSLENVSMSHNLYFKAMSKPTSEQIKQPGASRGRSSSSSSSSTTFPYDPSNPPDSSTMFSRALLQDPEDEARNETIMGILRIQDLPLLSFLALSNDELTQFPQLANLPNLSNLVLSQNRIRKIPPDTLSNLGKLERLDLSQNLIDDLPTIALLNLVELDLSRNLITELRKSALLLVNLQKLNLAKNKISFIDPNAFKSLGSLVELNLADNMLTFVPPGGATDPGFILGYSPLHFCTKLQRINLSRNMLNSITDDMRSNLLDLNKLDLSYNKFTSIHSLELNFLQSNLELDLSHNEISVMDMSYFHDFIDEGTGQLVVKLGGNPLNCDCRAFPFKTLSSSSVSFVIDDLYCAGPSSPVNLTNYPFQEVSKEDLTCAMDEASGCPEGCSCWRRPADFTVVVDCTRNRYTDGDSNFTLPNVTSLIPKDNYAMNKYEIVLNLADNGITVLPDDYASALPNNVRVVDLRRNKMRSLAFLKAIGNKNNMTRFNLSENPFPCYDCSFHTDSRSQFSRIADSDNLTCRIDGHVQKALEFDYESICTIHIISIVVPLVVAAVLLLAVTVVYIRNGWAIRAYLYSKGYGYLLCDSYLEDDEEKLYDAFVSYSHRDEAWVLEELVNRLEGQEGFKLCLHFRDWTPGDWIPDQIVRSVDQSRRTVVVLSKNFVESVWSRLEFKAAHSQALSDRSNRLILVLMGEDLTEKDVQDDDLRVYMKMNTYIKWNDPWFWHKLKYALPHRKCVVEENSNHFIKRVQRERAIQLDKMRTKMEESQVAA